MTGKPPLADAVLRSARPLPFDLDLVFECVNRDDPLDRRFARACADSLAALPPAERHGALGGVTGHVAESVVESIFAGHGWSPVWHFVGPDATASISSSSGRVQSVSSLSR